MYGRFVGLVASVGAGAQGGGVLQGRPLVWVWK